MDVLKRLVGAVLITVATASVATAQAPVIEYYHVDALGSVRAVTDASGAVLRTQHYHPFGEGEGVAPNGDPMGSTGKPRDAESGLDYFGARYYAQRTGRFTTVDPILDQQRALFDPQQWTRYVYARNNPLRYVDPDGRNIWDVVDFVSLAASARDVYRNPRDPWNWVSRGGDALGAALPLIPAPGTVVRAGRALDRFDRVKPTAFEIPRLDRSGKVHGDLPSYVPKEWRVSELEDVADGLRKSIKERKAEQIRLGEDGPHRNRIREEERLLRQIEKRLHDLTPKESPK